MDGPAFCRQPIWKPQNRGPKTRTCCVPLPARGVGDARLRPDEVATIRDIAVAEKVSERFVSRTMRLAYLSPIVLERLVAHRRPCSLSIKDLIAAAERPWCEQEALVFEN